MNQKKFKKKITNVAIVYRPAKPEALELACELGAWLTGRGIKVYSHPERKFKLKNKFAPVVKELNTLDLVIVLGGDGTYLEAVRLLNGKKAPILGINLGSLGFLTETPSEDLYPVMNMTLDGHMEMRPRSLLKVSVKNKGKVVSKASALNDIVIERGSRSQLISLQTLCGNLPVSEVKADGVIIATPTGSTAYNLAAGGPILHPDVAGFVLTPICPHSLTNRPIIFHDNQKLKLKLTYSHQATLTVDGKVLCNVSDKEDLIIEKCKTSHYVLKKPTHNYFDLLNKKLSFGKR